MRKEPNYLYLMASPLVTVVLITSAAPRSRPVALGIFLGVLSLMMASAFVMAQHKGQMLVAVALGMAAFFPFAWVFFHAEAVASDLAKGIYAITLGFWLLFTCYVGLIVLRTILAARHIRSNEIFGAAGMLIDQGNMQYHSNCRGPK